MKSMYLKIIEAVHAIEMTGRKPELIVIHPLAFTQLTIDMSYPFKLNPPFNYIGVKLIRSEDIGFEEVIVV